MTGILILIGRLRCFKNAKLMGTILANIYFKIGFLDLQVHIGIASDNSNVHLQHMLIGFLDFSNICC